MESILLSLPLELQLSIYEDSGNLHLKEVCNYIKGVFDTNLYGMDDFITKTNVKQKTISKVSVDILKKYSDDKELMTDLVKRSIPQPKPNLYFDGFGFGHGFVYHAYDYNYNYNRFWAIPDLPRYHVIKNQTVFSCEPIYHYNDIERTIEKLIKINDKEIVLNLIEIHSGVTNKKPDYYRLFNFCANHNNFELYKEFYEIKKKTQDPIFRLLGLFSLNNIDHFVKHENILALEYFRMNCDVSLEKIITSAIKLNSQPIFDHYLDKIDTKQTNLLITYLNECIQYNNLYAFKKIINSRDTIAKLLRQQCRMIKDYREFVGTNTSYFLAIRESCNCDKKFTDFMNSLIIKYLSVTIQPQPSFDVPDKNKQLIKIKTDIFQTIYKPAIQLNRFKDVEFMKYQQRAHKKYHNKQKLFKH